jgi:dipeptidyl aminopeptidase/acylaminoacyl peptidase
VIERYLQIRAATVAGHLPSGELGYLADVTGLLQLWRVAADGLHEQVTFASERITAALPSPSEERWVIARDTGGNERHALFAIDAAGGSERALSDDAEAIHVPGAFSPDGSQVAFTHTGRNGVDFDVAVVAVEGGERRELARPGGWSHVTDWSEHGILLQRANTPFDHDLFLVDPGSGALTHLTPHDGEVAYDSARLLPDGSVLCACDAGGEFARLALLRPGADPELLTPDDADVETVALDATRTRRAWAVNRGGASEVWLDGARVEGLPSGVVPALAFAPGGSLTVTAGPPDDSTDVWSAAPAVARRTRSAVGGLDRSGFVRPVLEEVESFDGRSIPYLRFGPHGRPALCWVHGGPESQFRPQMAPVIQYLCAQGITVAAPNVRGSTGYGRSYHHLDDVERRLDSVTDLAALGRALGAGSGIPVGVMGGSYGGYMTMAAITEHPELWACAVNIVGIVNFVTFLENTGAYRRALREAEYGSLERDRAFLDSISPIRKIDRIACPLMVIHGANDPRVPVSEAEQVVAALQARAAPVEYLRYEDEGHGITRLPNRLDCYPRVAAFLQRHLLARAHA